MKKILSLVLALVLVLTAVSALATGSKQKPTTKGTTDEELGVKFIGDTDASRAAIDSFRAAYEAGDPLSVLPENIRSQIPAGRTQINELLTAQFEGNISGITKDVLVTVRFETAYEKGSDVTVLLGILEDPIDWHTFAGKGQEDGSVQFKVPFAVFQKIMDNPFLIGVVN